MVGCDNDVRLDELPYDGEYLCKKGIDVMSKEVWCSFYPTLEKEEEMFERIYLIVF